MVFYSRSQNYGGVTDFPGTLSRASFPARTGPHSHVMKTAPVETQTSLRLIFGVRSVGPVRNVRLGSRVLTKILRCSRICRTAIPWVRIPILQFRSSRRRRGLVRLRWIALCADSFGSGNAGQDPIIVTPSIFIGVGDMLNPAKLLASAFFGSLHLKVEDNLALATNRDCDCPTIQLLGEGIGARRWRETRGQRQQGSHSNDDGGALVHILQGFS